MTSSKTSAGDSFSTGPPGRRIAGHRSAGRRSAGHRIAGHRIAGRRSAGRRSAGAPVAVLLLAVAALGAWPAGAVGGEAARLFRAGIEAADRGEWRDVADRMSRAAALEPEPAGRVKIYGMRFEAYVPDYWLGKAHDELGDCAAALPSFESVLARPDLDELLAPDLHRDLVARAERCRQQAAGAEEVLATTTEQAARAEPAPPFLRRAAANYLAGDYRAVASALERLDSLTVDPRAIGTGLLLRSAARFALYRQQTAPEETLLAQARLDLTRFRRLEPARRPSAFWFSPAFLDLYDQAGPPVPSEAVDRR